MGKHAEWRKIAKKARRKRIRRAQAQDRDQRLLEERQRLENSPYFQKWLGEQEEMQEQNREEEARQATQREEQWQQIEADAQEQWQDMQEKIALAREEKMKQNIKIKLEWEKEHKRLKELQAAKACSSRSTHKPRPPAPTPRPNITFLTYPCPPAYAAWFCLNGATCFTVKIEDSLLYNCMCAEGYQGSRCEYKDLDGSYMPSQRRFMLETASIAGGATIAVFSAVILCLAAYLRWRRRKKGAAASDEVDGIPRPRLQPIFGVRPQGQNLVPLTGSSLSRQNNHEPSRGMIPPHEPNLLPLRGETRQNNQGGQSQGDGGMPHDRGDHPATLLRGAPPWGIFRIYEDLEGNNFI